MGATEGLNQLKDLLFEEENRKYLELNNRLKEVNQRIDESLKDRELPDAEVNEIINQIVEIMPDKLGPTITATLKVQIRESRDDVVQALFPIIGQMIKKYVAQEMAVLTEKLDKQLESAFSFDKLALRIKAMMTGTSYSELLLAKSNEPEVDHIFIVEDESGLMMASYSKNTNLDGDVVAGMLTAIKAFVEDAFEEGNQALETISYDSYSIYVQNFNKFYVAVAMSGVLTAEFKSNLNDVIMKFVKDVSTKLTGMDHKQIEKKISQHFKRL